MFQKHLGTEPNEEEILCFSAQIALGLKEIHNFGILHRDIKPENILMTDKNRLVFCIIPYMLYLLFSVRSH